MAHLWEAEVPMPLTVPEAKKLIHTVR